MPPAIIPGPDDSSISLWMYLIYDSNMQTDATNIADIDHSTLCGTFCKTLSSNQVDVHTRTIGVRAAIKRNDIRNISLSL